MFGSKLGFLKKPNLLTNWSLVQNFEDYNAYGTTVADLFGATSALSKNYMIIGAFQEDSAASTEDGKAYVYKLDRGNNRWLYTLDNPNTYSATNPGTGDRFGFSVAINDTYCAVSANQEDDASNASAGAVYVFNLSDGSLRTTLTDPNAYGTTASDFFGFRIAMSDDYLICSAAYEDPSANTSNGGVIYVYKLSDMSLYWTIDDPNDDAQNSAGDYFGEDIAVSGDYFVVGAHGANSNRGHVYVFRLSDKTKVYSINSNDVTSYGTAVSDFLGQSVAISSKYFAASAPGEDNATYADVGAVYVWDLATGTLKYTINDPGTQAASDNMGSSAASLAAGTSGAGALSINDRFCAVGIRLKDTDGTNAGRAYVFDLNNSASLHTTINCPNSYGNATSDAFGRSLFLTNDRLVVTSLEDDSAGSTVGRAYLYTIDSSEPRPSGRTAKVITANGGVKYSSAQSKFRPTSLYFDGDSDYLTIPDSSDWNLGLTWSNFTVEGWFYISNGTGNHLIGGNEQASSSNGWALFHEDGELKWFSKGVSQAEQKTSGANLQLNTWTHIAVVGGSSYSVDIYVNGTRYYTGTASQGYADSTSVLNIGRGYGISNGQWTVSDTIGYNGYMEDVRISLVSRYTGTTFTPPGSLEDDSDTVLLLKGGQTNNVVKFVDYTYKKQ